MHRVVTLKMDLMCSLADEKDCGASHRLVALLGPSTGGPVRLAEEEQHNISVEQM